MMTEGEPVGVTEVVPVDLERHAVGHCVDRELGEVVVARDSSGTRRRRCP